MTNVAERKYRSKKGKEITTKIILYIVLIVISVIWIIPFIYLVLQSFATSYNAAKFIPESFTFQNYINLFTDEIYPFGRWYLNTLIIAIVCSVLQTIITLMTSYAFSRLRFKARTGYMKLILILGMFPSFLGMVVTYFILDLIGLEGSIFGLIIVYCAGAGMGYYISKGFFDTIPKSLDEAAMIDGASKNTIFWKVIIPLSKPIIVYTVLMSFTGPWGDYMLASYVAQGKQELFNVAVGLQQMLSKGKEVQYFPQFCAGGVFVSIGIMALFFWLQRYYVEGVTGGAVKG